MKINLQTGLLEGVQFLPSPHCDDRPDANGINMIVVHGISLPPGQFGQDAVQKFFCGKLDFSEHPYYAGIAHLRVAAHLLITRGGNIIQFVPFSKRAWHAGQSYFKGQSGCNDFSVGIELEGTDDVPYEKEQYLQLTKIIQGLQLAYPKISRERIVGHSDIAPGRKTDPGPFFDWRKLDCLLKEERLKFSQVKE